VGVKRASDELPRQRGDIAVLTPDGWELWYQRHHVPEKTRSLINAIRCSGLTPRWRRVLERLWPLSQ